jgi:hypothetical protein
MEDLFPHSYLLLLPIGVDLRRSLGSLQELLQHPPDPPLALPPTPLSVLNRASVEPQLGGKVGLGQPEPTPSRPESVRLALWFRGGVVPQESDDRSQEPRAGHVAAPLERGDVLLVDSEFASRLAVGQAKVHPPLAKVLPQRPRLSRVTAWHVRSSACLEPHVGKRQRWGVHAAGSGIRSVAAGAPPPSSRSTPRA